MSGYWGDREKTDRVLVQNPVHGRFPDPVYRTGDLVRFDDRELLRFLGRRDHQVKVRGYRIELGEIEAALHAHEAVSEAACVLRPNATGDPTIVGVVAFRAGAVVDVGVLRDHCVASVPRYMVPDAFEVLDTLPRTSTGKTDRQAIARLLESTG
jgi:acyl-coenzyme A synthetase/AMP-(fatty) acid ligase